MTQIGAWPVWPRLRPHPARVVAPIVAVLVGSSALAGDMPRAIWWNGNGGARQGVFEIRGMSYPSFHNGNYATKASTESLAQLAKAGANFVAIVPTRFSATITSNTFAATDHTESDANVVKAISDAHAVGLSVLLKPHVDAMDGQPRSDYKPSDIDAWFRNYETFLVHYAGIAARHGVEMFGIGCELDSLVGERYRQRWLHIIKAVRAVYGGPLLYASDWTQAQGVSFWGAVDYIGVDAYDPLSSAANPSVRDMIAGWSTVSSNSWVAARTNYRSPLANYRDLWERYHKPVIFSEIGYRSTVGAATRPGDWKLHGPVDLKLQANAYEAFFEVWSRQASWMKGAFLWNWEPELRPEKSPGGLGGYTPQGKPAEKVIAKWYEAMADISRGGHRPLPPPVPGDFGNGAHHRR